MVDKYRAAGNDWPATAMTISKWAIDNGLAERSRYSQQQMLARSIAVAMREEICTDAQGRRVRKKHCYPKWVDTPSGVKKQKFLWCDIETASPDQFRAAIQYRRKQMVGDAKQLKTDVDSYNDNNPHGAQVPLQLNLTFDVEEGSLDTEYNPPPHADE